MLKRKRQHTHTTHTVKKISNFLKTKKEKSLHQNFSLIQWARKCWHPGHPYIGDFTTVGVPTLSSPSVYTNIHTKFSHFCLEQILLSSEVNK